MIKLEKISLSDGGVHLIVKAFIDEKPIRMVLDTGASHSVLDVNWAKENLPDNEIKLVEDPAYGIGSSVEVHKADVSSFTIGKLKLENRLVALIDFDPINAVYKREGLDKVQGILGGDIMAEFGGVIDYRKYILNLWIRKRNPGFLGTL
jgi:hypothetical protein